MITKRVAEKVDVDTLYRASHGNQQTGMRRNETSSHLNHLVAVAIESSNMGLDGRTTVNRSRRCRPLGDDK